MGRVRKGDAAFADYAASGKRTGAVSTRHRLGFVAQRRDSSPIQMRKHRQGSSLTDRPTISQSRKNINVWAPDATSDTRQAHPWIATEVVGRYLIDENNRPMLLASVVFRNAARARHGPWVEN